MNHRQSIETAIKKCCTAAFIILSTMSGFAAQLPNLNFDWDDNIARMETVIVVFHKTTRQELEISTHLFALVRDQIGKPGTYEDYEYDYNGTTGSFRYFRDQSHTNHFLDDVRHLVENLPPAKWQAPMWSLFQHALAYPETARLTKVVTTRGHSPLKMLEALAYLQNQGLIKNLPEEANLHGANQDRYVGLAPTPAKTKAIILERDLTELEAMPVRPDFVPLVDRDGTGTAATHLWVFSDDDLGYIQTVASDIGPLVAQGRFSHTKIMLIYTGTGGKALEPGAYIMTSAGTLRPATPQELTEPVMLLDSHAQHSDGCAPSLEPAA